VRKVTFAENKDKSETKKIVRNSEKSESLEALTMEAQEQEKPSFFGIEFRLISATRRNIFVAGMVEMTSSLPTHSCIDILNAFLVSTILSQKTFECVRINMKPATR